MKKKDFVSLIRHCVEKGVDYEVFVRRTGDGWIEPFGYTIYLWVSEIDEFMDSLCSRGIYRNSLILQRIGGHKHYLSAEEIDKIKERVTVCVEKFNTWAKSTSKKT